MRARYCSDWLSLRAGDISAVAITPVMDLYVAAAWVGWGMIEDGDHHHPLKVESAYSAVVGVYNSFVADSCSYPVVVHIVGASYAVSSSFPPGDHH